MTDHTYDRFPLLAKLGRTSPESTYETHVYDTTLELLTPVLAANKPDLEWIRVVNTTSQLTKAEGDTTNDESSDR
jgi:hypothetical protein